MKKLLLIILFVPVLAQAQLQSYLTGSTPKTHRELQGSPTATTRLDTIIHSITIVLDSTVSSLQRYSLNAGNYATIASGLTDARNNRAPLIVPYDWTGGSPAPTTADSNVTIFDYRFGSFGFTGRRHWGFKSVFEADSLNRFRKILDSTRTWGRINLAEGTWSLDSIRISRPIFLQGTASNRIKTTDTGYGGAMLKSTAASTAINLLRVDQSGVHISDLTLQGNSRLNGHGFYSQRQPVSGTINTTLGGYGLTRVSSFFHGGSGFYLIGGDGNIYHELESFRNAGYGVVGISPSSAGLASAGATARGTTNLYFGGRSRANSLGGWLFDDQAATGYLNAEAIGDTSVGVWFKNGTSRSWMIAGDVEMQIPARTSTPLTYGVKVEDMQGFYMGQTFIGTAHDFGDFTADAGTNTTTIVDAALVNYGPNGYFIGADVVNNTRSSGEVRITGYTASTGTLTLASAIASQTTGDSYTLSKDQNAGLRLKNLTSGIFVNNTFGSNVDTMIATVGDGGALFVNNVNFDPEDNLKEISGTFKWLYINTANVDSLSGGANTILMKSSNDFIIQSLDSLLLKSTGASKGVEIEATAGKVAIQPNAEGGVHLFGQVGDDENPDFRIHYDADTTAAVTSLKYFDFGGSLTQPNIFNIQNVDDSQALSFGTKVRFSGADSSERFIEIQNQSNGQVIPTPSNGFVAVFTRADTLYGMNDSGTEFNLFAAGAGDIGGVTAGDGLSGGGTSGTVTVTFNPKLISQTLEIVADSVRVKAASIGANELSSTTVTPGSYTSADITVDADGRITTAASGAGGGITTATARRYTGWTATGAAGGTATDTLATKFILDHRDLQFHTVDADNDSVSFIPQSLYPFNYKDATTQLAAVDSLGRVYSALGYDAVGAAPIQVGSADVTAITLTTDGTGNDEVVLPAQSVTGSEITNDSITPTQVDEAQSFAWTVDQAFRRATYFAADADSFKVDLRTQLYPIDLEIGDAQKFAVDSTGKLYLPASGSVINFNAGDVTLTHSSNAVTVAGGDLFVPTEAYDATNWDADNSVPTKDAVRDKIETISSGESSMTTVYSLKEDWVSGAANTSGAMGKDFQRTIATSGTTTHQTGESGRPGIMRFFCANSAGSTAALHTDVASFIVNSAYVLTTSVRFSSLGTAATNGAYYRIGFMDDVGATIPTDGAWIEFNVDSSATRWRAVTGNGGTRTITTDGVLTVSANTWYKLTITPNSGGTSFVFAVDGTTIATHTTNLPTGGVGVAMVAAAVTASATKYMEVDYIQVLNTGLSR